MDREILLKIRTGSHLYGLSTPESDEDFGGIFLPKPEDVLGLQKMEEVDKSTKPSSKDEKNTKDDVDEKYYSLGKYLHLVLQNNPNIVEYLFVDTKNTLVTSPIWEELQSNYEKIISQKVWYSFSGYAYSQRKNMIVKRDRYNSLVKGVDYIEKAYSHGELVDPKYAISEKESSDLNGLLKYYKGSKGNTEHYHKGMPLATIYEKLVEERDKYGWRVKTDTFKSLGYSVKFGYHLIRLMAEAFELLRFGNISYPLSGADWSTIMSIRNGNVPFDDLMKMYDVYYKQCEEEFKRTRLRKTPDWKWGNKWLINTLLEEFTKEK